MITDRRKKKRLMSGIFSFKMFILASILAVIFLGTGLGKEFYRDYQIKKEIDSLQSDINALEKDNYKLSQLIEYYKTDEYKEAEARKRFNLKEEGESVVVIKPNENSMEYGEVKGATANENLPNYIKWWNYFFASK